MIELDEPSELTVDMAVDEWERAIDDIGWELLYLSVPLVDGAMDIADLANQIENRNLAEWVLMLIGHDPTDGSTQLCFRRAVPGRDEQVREIRRLQRHVQGRQN